jgi:hypothetical protein
MKNLSILILSFFMTVLISNSVLFGQNTGDFRSAQSGNWSDLTTWQTYNGSGWVAASTIPDSTSPAAVTILSPHSIIVFATIGVRNVTVNSGATVNVAGSPVVLYIALEGMSVNGTLTLFGDVPAAAPFSVTKTTGTLTIGNGGVVNYNQTGTTKGALPTAVWLTGSTLNVNAVGIASSTGWNAGSGQNFYNINWNCPLQSANFGWGFTASTVGGNVTVLNTNTGRLQFCGGSSGTLNIMGDLIVSGAASATTNGTGSATNDTVNIYGKVNVNTTGNFSISRGSQASAGTAVFNFYGDSIKIIAGTMGNSNTSTDGTKFIFRKSGTQYLTVIPTVLTGNALPIEVDAGTTLSLQSSVNVTTLYLNGGIIVSTVSNPLVIGWWTGTSLTSGTISPTAPGNATSYVNGAMSFLYATAGSTSKTYPIGKGGIYRPLILSFNQTAATLSTYTAEMFNSAAPLKSLPPTLDKVSNARYYVISQGAGGSSFTAGSVSLNFSGDDGVSDATNLRIAQGQVNGGIWVDLGGAGSGSPAGTITSSSGFTDLTASIVFTLANHTGGGNVLPVELSSFTVSNYLRNILVKWVTSSEKNCNKFEIERALVNMKGVPSNWLTAGTIQASGTSTSTKNYSFTEKNLQAGKYQYRLKMVDYDGSYKYSSIEATEISLPKNFDLSQNYPNPFNPSTKINYSLPFDSKVVLDVYNLIGERVIQLVNKEQAAGYYSVDFNSSIINRNIPSGVYLYRISSVDKVNGNNFSIVKKMMLLK